MTENIYSVLQAKLALQYPSTQNGWTELWRAYWADPDGGNNNGVPLVGDALMAHIGGTGDFAARFAAWTAALSFESAPAGSPEIWLKANALALADAAPVVTWTDSSGNAHDFGQGTAGLRPTFRTAVLNGLPIVRFDGTNDFMGATAVTVGQFTIFMVVDATNLGIFYEHGVDGYADDIGGFYCYADQNSSILVGRNADANFISGTSKNVAAGWGDDGGFRLLRHRFGGTHATHTLHRDGVEIATTASDLSWDGPYAAVQRDLYLCARAGSIAPLAGDVAEFILYDTALSAPDIATTEAYLNAKYDL